ncbi:uncharacterized protein LOC110980400 [Acanthaster planci]|uniref:Uncharacterized protein LOC110980400 n=1 Tax=Acanthaster planci TaxID=133434 RepID=A0A8B7YHK1_ACAPL|nr:uncharacterized protein LOC110980400 [Acanthaster planci]XP_022092729.1 uncharacterized protein LOC110980400 [Acanthaster planci]
MSRISRNGERLLDSESLYPWYSREADQELQEGEGSSRPVQAEHKAEAKPPRWPWFIWFLLKLLGLYNRRPAVARRRRCLQCRLTAVEMRCVIRGKGVPGYLYPGASSWEDEEEGPEDSGPGTLETQFTINGDGGSEDSELGFVVPEDPCLVCQSEWWDAYGRHRPYTEADIGVSKWNHYGSPALSVIWQVLILAINMVHYFSYFAKYWGEAERRFDLVIYSGFVLFVVSVPALCLVANIINMLPSWRNKSRSYAWSNALSIRYIVKRLQHLKLTEQGLPYKAFLLVCLAWPLGNSIGRVALFHDVSHTIVHISLASCTVTMEIWGAFCYIVVLMRLSFQSQFEVELAFLRKHSDAMDRCRRRLTLLMEEFGSLGSLATLWVMFTIAVATWSIATQVYFDYAVNSMHNKTIPMFNTSRDLDPVIWSEIMMFLLLPLMAVGGLDLNRLWISFKRHIGEMRLIPGRSYDAFCDKILAYCNEHPPVRSIETVTLLVSALGLCLAVEFKEIEQFEFHHSNHL